MNESTPKSDKPALFEPAGTVTVHASAEAAAMARATQEIQAALVIAKRFPRDEARAIQKITVACQRKALAEEAEYEYNRGGTRITGPTIDLLRAIANRWGNIRFGWSEVERRLGEPGESLVRCEAWDTENNGYAFREFRVKHWRDTQGGGYGLSDERDIYELLANMAARRVRACLEEVIDADIVTMAVDVCRETLKKGEKVPLRDRAAKMLVEFQQFGVTQEMVELRLGNKLDAISENQLASLRRVWKSLHDGVGSREDYFKPAASKPDFGAQPPAEAPQPPAQGSAQSSGGVSTPQPAPKSSPAPAQQTPSPIKKAEPTPAETPQKPPAAPSGGFNPVKGVNGLCNMDGIPVGKLLDYLAGLGATDGSCTSLEEVHLQNPALLKSVADSWPDISKNIKAEMGKEKKD